MYIVCLLLCYDKKIRVGDGNPEGFHFIYYSMVIFVVGDGNPVVFGNIDIDYIKSGVILLIMVIIIIITIDYGYDVWLKWLKWQWFFQKFSELCVLLDLLYLLY